MGNKFPLSNHRNLRVWHELACHQRISCLAELSLLRAAGVGGRSPVVLLWSGALTGRDIHGLQSGGARRSLAAGLLFS